MTLQCLSGTVDSTAPGQTQRMTQGNWLWLAGGAPYTLTAIDDAALLPTIAVCRTGKPGGI